MSVFITGGSRGIGLSLVRAVLTRSPQLEVVAASRTACESKDLLTLQQQFGEQRLSIRTLDLTDESSIEAAAVGFDSVPLLIHCGAMMHRSGKGENTVRRLAMDEMSEVMKANVLGPALLTKALWPALTGAAKAGGTEAPAKVIAVGAGVGSIEQNGAGGWFSYRISKTALNALMKNLAIEGARSNVLTMTMYPEMVDTQFAKPYLRGNPYPQLREPDEVAEAMLAMADGMRKADSGRFVNLWSGQDIPF